MDMETEMGTVQQKKVVNRTARAAHGSQYGGYNPSMLAAEAPVFQECPGMVKKHTFSIGRKHVNFLSYYTIGRRHDARHDTRHDAASKVENAKTLFPEGISK